MSVDNIICILELFLNNTYFMFQGKYFEQVKGAAMGSSISPIVANLYMGNFEVEAIGSAPHPPYLWKRYVDNTFTIIQSSHRNEFLKYINSIDEHIQFICEDQREDGSMSFLDILITPEEDGSLSITVYRKLTHTDLYLQWDSHHTLTSKYSVIGTLHHRAKTICFSPQLLQKKENQLCSTLTRCKYPTWALNKIRMKTKKLASNKDSNNNNNSSTNKNT